MVEPLGELGQGSRAALGDGVADRPNGVHGLLDVEAAARDDRPIVGRHASDIDDA